MKLSLIKSVPQTSAILGVDFTSTPTKRKAITVAWGQLDPIARVVQVDRLQGIDNWPEFEAFLKTAPTCVAGFDFPFSLPRELIETLGWPTHWPQLMQHLQHMPREQLRLTFKAFCDARAVGNKFAHRATDIPAGSSPSMKWVNPPVAYMLHEGAPRLLKAGWSLPLVHPTAAAQIALEAYPGLVARGFTKQSYKSDDAAKQTPERRENRALIVHSITRTNHWGLEVALPRKLADFIVSDPTGDWLDAVLCLFQAGWGALQGEPYYGLPRSADPLEGWILGAEHVSIDG
jgi:Protein of unknown function (DUF429)